MNVPFRLYGLIGCLHCKNAEEYLRSHRLPAELIIANGDPIITAGAKAVTGSDNYPVLVCAFGGTQEVITGFKQEEYERVDKAFTAFASASTSSLFGGGLQPSGQNSPEAPAPTEGAN